MAFYGRQFSTASPVLTVSPHPPHQAPFGLAGFSRQAASSSSPFGHLTAPGGPSTPFQPTPSASRKRSRDEAAVNLDPEVLPPKPQQPEEEWVYGPGMTLVKSTKTYVTEAASQSGTWLEEKKTVEEETRRQSELDRKLLAPRSSKLQRVGGAVNHDSSSMAPAAGLASVTSQATSDNKAPVIDDFTLHLGIGWRKLSDDAHIQAAARGWARYIENHFPITNAHVRLESSGLQSYLVEGSEGFYLFSEDLRQGQLVSTSVDGVLRNLQTSPPTFDGLTTLNAADSPSPSSHEASTMDAEMHMG